MSRRLHLYLALCTLLSWLLFVVGGVARAADKDFTVVIDAGHGGHDPGAVGRISKEKDINLRVALRVGKLIEDGCPDVKVVYTRKKDVFVPLARRAEIANNAKADLFISIHTNALEKNRTFQGASTWTLGLAKSEANLEVAKRENGVILYEDDYRQRYAGFDPNSAESYIIFEFMQDQYMAQSVQLASLMQKEFRETCHRIDRGVHQAGFLVLKQSAMPSVLVELGFISTPAEERYLNTEEATASLSNGIYRAFLAYKAGQQAHLSTPADARPEGAQPEATPATPPAPGGPGSEVKTVFKVQILTSRRPLQADDKQLRGVEGVECYEENGLYKYVTAATTDLDRATEAKKKLSARFKDAFIVAFKGERRVDTKAAIEEYRRK